MSDQQTVERILTIFDAGRAELQKFAFTPTAAPAPPMTAMPPGGDPNAMPPGGDPNAMPPGGDPNAMPPGGDPNAMPPGGDPNAMPPGGGPVPIPPELEGMLSEMANGMQGIAQAVEEQQGTVDQLSQRLMALEEQQSAFRDELKAPAAYEAPQQAAPAGPARPMAPPAN